MRRLRSTRFILRATHCAILAAAAAFIVTVVSAETGIPMADPNISNRTTDGFRNIYPDGPRGSFLKWQWERLEKGLPKTPEGGYRFELLKPDVARLKANRTEPTLTWI